MYAAVHTDRTGRVYVSTGHAAAAHDGSRTVPFRHAIPIPPQTSLLPLPRDAEGFDRRARARPLGRGRLALAAVLPPGYARAQLPAYTDVAGEALDPLAYAAVAADEHGDIVVSAIPLVPDAVATANPERVSSGELSAIVREALAARPANRLVRQLARCAREFECQPARLALGGGGDPAVACPTLPVPLAARSNEHPSVPIDLASGRDEHPTERAAFRPSAAEVADLAVAHLARPGARVTFGQACEGEPLLDLHALEGAVGAMRERTKAGEVHLETNGSVPTALRRIIDAGLDAVTVRICSARTETYEVMHGPQGYRWPDVRASLQLAAQRRIRITLAVLVLVGLADRDAEVDALVALLGELPGGTLELRELGADPQRTIAALPPARPAGVRTLLDRLAQADHFRLSSPSGPAAA